MSLVGLLWALQKYIHANFISQSIILYNKMLSFEEKGSDPRVNIKDHTNFNEKKSLKFTKLYFSFTSKQC